MMKGMGTLGMKSRLASALICVAVVAAHAGLSAATLTSAAAATDVELLHDMSQKWKWKSRAECSEHLIDSAGRIKTTLEKRSGRQLRDEDIINAIKSARDRHHRHAPRLFTSEWADQFAQSDDLSSTSDDVQPIANRRRNLQPTDRIIGFGISALSPGFPWNVPAPEGEPSFYCAGASLQDPTPPQLYGVRPEIGQEMVLLDCEKALATERGQSQVIFEYNRNNEGTLNFTLISENDPYADPWGWCVSLNKIRKNEELIAEYCDITSIEQVWQIIPQDNTWRPEEEWYDIDGNGLCVEAISTVPSEGVGMHLRQCTYDDEEARQRQSWIWCYQDTQCTTSLSTPPDFTLQVDCQRSDVQTNLRCDDTSLTGLNTEFDGSVPPGIYSRLDECRNDPIDDRRFGRSLIYRINTNANDQYLLLNLDSDCDIGGDDADRYIRVYEEQSNGDWDCMYWSSTYCREGFNTITIPVDPHSRDVLVIVSSGGADFDEADFSLQLECTTEELLYQQIQLGQDPDLCFGVSDNEPNARVELSFCDEQSDFLLWWLDEDRLLRLKDEDDSDLCAEIDGNYVAGTGIRLAECNRFQETQKWRYNRFNDDEISSDEDSGYCLTYNIGRDTPSAGYSVEIDNCSGSSRQEWSFSSAINPSPSPPTSRPSDLYCAEEVRRNVEDDNEGLPSDGSYDNRFCLEPDDVFDDSSSLLQTYEIIDTAGIEMTVELTSECNGRTGDGNNDGQTTLFRAYRIIEDNNGNVEEYQCRRSASTTCDNDDTSDSTSFNLEGIYRYLIVATGVRVDIVECEISDGCTRNTGDGGLGRVPSEDEVDSGRNPDPDPTNLVASVWVKISNRRNGWRRRRKRRRRKKKIYCNGLVKAMPDRWCFERIARGKYKNNLVKDVCMSGCAEVSTSDVFKH